MKRKILIQIERWWNFGFRSIGGCPEKFEFYFKWFKYKALACYKFHKYNQATSWILSAMSLFSIQIFPFLLGSLNPCLYTYSMSNLIWTKIAQTENKEIEFDHLKIVKLPRWLYNIEFLPSLPSQTPVTSNEIDISLVNIIQ